MSAGLCERADLASLDHLGYHHGYPCPYDVIEALLDGLPDPRDLVAEWRVDITATLKPNGSVPLSLNGGHSNAFAVNAARDKIKARVRNAVRDAGVPPLAHAHVELHYRPKTNAHRDVDNIVATLKPAIDALHQPDEPSGWVGILPGDDPRFVSWTPPMLHAAERGRPPALWLLLRTYAPPTREDSP